MGSFSSSLQSLSMQAKEQTPQGANYTGTKQFTRKETQHHQVFDGLKKKGSNAQKKFTF